MNFTTMLNYLPRLLHGTFITLSLLICALTLGLILAFLLTLGDLSNKKYLQWPIRIYIFVVRGTPLLVQFFLIYFGSSQFVWLRESLFWPIFQNPFSCAILALGINTSAYSSVLLKGAVRSIPKGQIEAAKALGMSWFLMMRRIILPKAIRIALPAYSNEVVMVLKGTSLASTITILDLMGVTQRIITETYAAIPFLLLAGAIYFILNALLISLFHYFEKRWHVL